MATTRVHVRQVVLDPRSLLSGAALAIAVGSDVVLWPLTGASLQGGFLLAVLTAGVILSGHISLPIRSGMRVWLASVPVYLIAALLPPAAAMAVMGVAVGAKELSICWKCRNTAAQVAGQTARWMLLALVGSYIAHTGNILLTGLFLIAFLYIGDILTAPLVLPGVKLPGGIMRLISQSWASESMQYLVAYLALPVLVEHGRHEVVVLATVIVLVLWMALWGLLVSPGGVTISGDR